MISLSIPKPATYCSNLCREPSRSVPTIWKIEYKNGREEVFAVSSGIGVAIAGLDSSSEEACARGAVRHRQEEAGRPHLRVHIHRAGADF